MFTANVIQGVSIIEECCEGNLERTYLVRRCGKEESCSSRKKNQEAVALGHTKSWRCFLSHLELHEIMLGENEAHLAHIMAANTDRRRNNAPSGGTHAPVFSRTLREPEYLQTLRPTRTRGPNELRRICKFLFRGLNTSWTSRYDLSSEPSLHKWTSRLISANRRTNCSLQSYKPALYHPPQALRTSKYLLSPPRQYRHLFHPHLLSRSPPPSKGPSRYPVAHPSVPHCSLRLQSNLRPLRHGTEEATYATAPSVTSVYTWKQH
jgi:hypothetical protein